VARRGSCRRSGWPPGPEGDEGGEEQPGRGPGVASRVDRYRPSDGSTVTMKSNARRDIQQVGREVTEDAPSVGPEGATRGRRGGGGSVRSALVHVGRAGSRLRARWKRSPSGGSPASSAGGALLPRLLRDHHPSRGRQRLTELRGGKGGHSAQRSRKGGPPGTLGRRAPPPPSGTRSSESRCCRPCSRRSRRPTGAACRTPRSSPRTSHRRRCDPLPRTVGSHRRSQPLRSCSFRTQHRTNRPCRRR
jgi:hypothetical protein